MSTLRELGRTAEYFERLKLFVDRNADPALAERALNDLGTFHILANEDEKAAEVFADLYRALSDRRVRRSRGVEGRLVGVPDGRLHRDRSHLRVGRRRACGARISGRPGCTGPRDRARRLGQTQAAFDGLRARHRRLSQHVLRTRGDARDRARFRRRCGPPARGRSRRRAWTGRPTSPPAARVRTNAPLIQSLLAAGMYDEAIGELRRLQASGLASPLVEATIAFALNRQGKLRPAINVHAPRVSAVHGGRRGSAARGNPDGDFPGRPLGDHQARTRRTSSSTSSCSPR